MAVDTGTKRYAMVNFGAGDEMFPVPDNSLTAPDRHQFLSGYEPTAAGGTLTYGQMMMMGLGG